MERLLFVMTLFPGAEAEYERRHEAVWPELLDDIWQAGLRNYSLFRRGRHVYAYAECHPDRATALAALDRSQANARWSEYFEDVIEVLSDEHGLIQADEVWNLEEARQRANLA